MSTNTTHSSAELAEFERLRRQRVIEDGLVRQQVCPNATCQAQPGEDCRSASWYIVPQFHSGRRRLAAEAAAVQ